MYRLVRSTPLAGPSVLFNLTKLSLSLSPHFCILWVIFWPLAPTAHSHTAHISPHSTLLSAIRTKPYWRTFHVLSSYVPPPRRLIAHICSSINTNTSNTYHQAFSFVSIVHPPISIIIIIYIIYLLAITIIYLLWLFITVSSRETRTHSQSAPPPSHALFYNFSLY